MSRFVESPCTWARFCPFQEAENGARLELSRFSSNEAQFGLRVTLRWLGFGSDIQLMQVMLYPRRKGAAWTLPFSLLKQGFTAAQMLLLEKG